VGATIFYGLSESAGLKLKPQKEADRHDCHRFQLIKYPWKLTTKGRSVAVAARQTGPCRTKSSRRSICWVRTGRFITDDARTVEARTALFVRTRGSNGFTGLCRHRKADAT